MDPRWWHRPGIDGFVKWFAAPGPEMPSTSEVFGSAPRELARKISLYQTVELVRTTIEVVEKQIDELMPRGDRPSCMRRSIQYSREVAFSAAEIYARAAELRGAWDERLEALVVDAVLRGRDRRDSAVPRVDPRLALPSAVWLFVVGPLRRWNPLKRWRRFGITAAIAGTDMLGAVQGRPHGRRVGRCPRSMRLIARWTSSADLSRCLVPGAVIVGPPVEHLMDARRRTREAVSAYRAAAGLAGGPAAGSVGGPAARAGTLR
jgi:hypothetical protein